MKLRNSEKCAIIITLCFLALVLGYHIGRTKQSPDFVVTEYSHVHSPVQKDTFEDAAEVKISAAGKININTATSEELQSLYGIGPVLAQRIIDYREENGGFRKIEDITSVSGISVKTYEEVKDLITVE